jgi:hypothetical protein
MKAMPIDVKKPFIGLLGVSVIIVNRVVVPITTDGPKIALFFKEKTTTGRNRAATVEDTINAVMDTNGSKRVRIKPCCFAASESGSEWKMQARNTRAER